MRGDPREVGHLTVVQGEHEDRFWNGGSNAGEQIASRVAVESVNWLVEQEHGGSPQDALRNGHAAALAARQRFATRPDWSVQARGEPADGFQ